MTTLATKGFEDALEKFDSLASQSPHSLETYRARRALVIEARALVRALDARIASVEERLGINR